MIRRLLSLALAVAAPLLALALAASSPAQAQVSGGVTTAKICDPATLANCAKPNSDGSINVKGALTVNAGTNTSTAALALETGGNLSGAKTDLDSVSTSTASTATNTAATATSTASTATNTSSTATNLGAAGATACATDTGSCSINALLQRLAVDITAVKTQLGAAPMQATGGAVTVGVSSTDGSGTITTGGSPQALFSGATPTNGFKVAIPSSTPAAFICWLSDTTATPSATTPGSYPVQAAGQYSSEVGEKPAGPVYLTCPTTGQAFSAKKW
jgi:hypothetical protein